MKPLEKRKKIEEALIKRALGYEAKEIIEEYAESDEGEKLTKRKVTVKDVPPDLNAVKILLEDINCGGRDVRSMTDAELEAEKTRLLNLLKENRKIGTL